MKAARPKGILANLSVDIINEGAGELSFRLDDTAYRQEGVSIGQDYLRMEGVTVSRGELLPDLLDIQEIIGKGAFSTVRRARWQRRGATTADTHGVIDVAIKDCSCLANSSRQRRQMLLKELRSLNKMTTPTLVQLHGAFLQPDSDTVTMVLEYMDRGSLEDLLRRRQQQGRTTTGVFLTEQITAAIAYQILAGLSYLHAPERRMLHRDLKPANVLLNSSGCVKLCDFGMAALLGEDSLNRTVLGTTKFMAPERLRARAYGRPSDVWSFGLVVMECVTGEAPWKDVDSMVDLLVTIEESTATDLVGSVESKMSTGLQEILVGCLHNEPAKRIPASLLLHSPWFSEVHNIHSRDDAVELMKAYCCTK